MDSLLIIKTGTTLSPIAEEHGDFEDWITAGMGIDPQSVKVVSVFEGETLPDPTRLAGVVITGSGAMVSDREPWSERTERWIVTAVENETPILGICYGHQLLAQALGGRVGPNPLGREIGTVEVRLEESAAEDKLLAGFSGPLSLHVSHWESVLNLPEGAVRLSVTDGDPNSAFCFGEVAWGVQFHPEFCAAVMSEYIMERREVLCDEGIAVDERLQDVMECPDGTALLRRFSQLLRIED
jgi:GMP synthase (glutamine-hydrolysing)